MNQGIDALIKSQKANSNKLIQEEIAELEKRHKAGKIKVEQYEKEKNALRAKMANKGVAIEIAILRANEASLTKIIKEHESKRANLKVGSQGYINHQNQLESYKRQLASVSERLNGMGNAVAGTLPTFLKDVGGGAGGAGGDKRSAYAKMIDDLDEKIAALKSEILDPGTKEAIERLEELKNGKYGKEGQKPENIKAAEGKLLEIRALKEYNEALKAITEKSDTFKQKISGLKAELSEMPKEGEQLGDWIFDLQANLVQFSDQLGGPQKAAIEQAIKDLNALGDTFVSLDRRVAANKMLDKATQMFMSGRAQMQGESAKIIEMINDINKAIENATDPDEKHTYNNALTMALAGQDDFEHRELQKGIKLKEDYAKRAEEIEIGLMHSSIDATKAKHEAELKYARESLRTQRANGELTEAAYQQALQGYSRWAAAMTARLASELRTPIEKMAEEWSSIYDDIKSAEVDWANGFVDNLHKTLSTGKASWREYLYGVATDIEKILLKKTIAEPISNFIGGVGDKLVSVFGNSQEQNNVAGNPGFWERLTTAGKDLWKSLTGASEGADGLAKSAGDSVAGIAKGIAQSSVKMTAEMSATAAITSLATAAQYAAIQLSAMMGGASVSTGPAGSFIQSAAGSLFNHIDIGWASASSNFMSMPFSDISAFSTMFANGGIMTEFGSVPLRKYANGGVAKTPQLAMFGEGSTPEAYVPLPDGRSIPVSMQGGGGVNQAISINITVNKDGTSNESTTGDEAGTWKKMADRVKGVVREELVTQQRPGGILYR